MAPKFSPNSLIHCAICGEDYSATYKRCPFCGAKNAPPADPPPRRRVPPPEPEYEPEPEPAPQPRRRPPADPDDTYVFDGQGLFDDDNEYEYDDYEPAYPKGGKRLAESPSSGPFANTDINWPRVITFVCSLVIIAAALVIVFTAIYPQLRGNKDPVADNPSAAVSDPAGEQSNQPVDPITTGSVPEYTEPGTMDTTEPPVEPATQPPLTGPGDDEPASISFKGVNDGDFTLQPNESHVITLNINPSSWAGTITWTSSDPTYATVDANGKVTNVNTTDRLHNVIVTATAGSISVQSTVRCRGTSGATAPSTPPATNPPVQSDPPVTTTQAPPSGGGNVVVGQQGTIVGADGGLRVRSGPGTSHGVISSLQTGDTVNVVSDAGGGWYEITFQGNGGNTITGYIMGEFISSN